MIFLLSFEILASLTIDKLTREIFANCDKNIKSRLVCFFFINFLNFSKVNRGQS